MSEPTKSSVNANAPLLRWQGEAIPPQRFALSAFETLIGRSEDCDIAVSHPSVSRQHAKILATSDGMILLDLASLHGTFVNDQRVHVCMLSNDDRIRFGKAPELAVFESGGDGSASPREVPEFGVSATEVLGTRVVDMLRDELRKSLRHRYEIESELRLAEEIQKALVPSELPEVAGYRTCGYSAPTRFVGGDFYDLFGMPTGCVSGCLGDVSGKGVPAALVSAMALGCLGAQLRARVSLEDAATTLNDLMCEKHSGRFVTLFLCQLLCDGHGHYLSAGHNTAYVHRAHTGEVSELASTSLIAGVMASCTFRSEAMDLQEGDVLLVYSDGLTEAENAEGDMFGEERVLTVIRRLAPQGADALRDGLLSELADFTENERQSDDITLFIIERKALLASERLRPL